MNTVKKFVNNPTFVLAAFTVISVIAGIFGIQIPHVPDSIVSVILGAATAFHAVSAQEAAYLQGVVDAAQNGKPAPTPPAAS